MNNTYLDPWDGIGWTAAWAKVSERGEIEIREYFTYFEEGHPHNQWLLIFDNEHEAEACVVATAYDPAPKDREWAVVECTAFGLLAILRDNRNIKGVVFRKSGKVAYAVPARILIGALSNALGEPEGNAA
jgi:hypothetical protein